MEALFTMGAQLLFRAPMDKKWAHVSTGMEERCVLRSNSAELITLGRIYLIDGRRSPQPPSTPPAFAKPRALLRGFCFMNSAGTSEALDLRGSALLPRFISTLDRLGRIRDGIYTLVGFRASGITL
jgi:hypothetical protein